MILNIYCINKFQGLLKKHHPLVLIIEVIWEMKFTSFIDDHNIYLVWAFVVLNDGRFESVNVNYFSSYDLYHLSPYEIYF